MTLGSVQLTFFASILLVSFSYSLFSSPVMDCSPVRRYPQLIVPLLQCGHLTSGGICSRIDLISTSPLQLPHRMNSWKWKLPAPTQWRMLLRESFHESIHSLLRPPSSTTGLGDIFEGIGMPLSDFIAPNETLSDCILRWVQKVALSSTGMFILDQMDSPSRLINKVVERAETLALSEE